MHVLDRILLKVGYLMLQHMHQCFCMSAAQSVFVPLWVLIIS